MVTERKKNYLTFRKFRTKKVLDNGKTIFDTKGSIIACCDIDTESQSMRVGFSFLNPTDSQLFVQGRGLAQRRLKRSPVAITGLEPTDGGKLKVNEALIAHLKTAFTLPAEETCKHLGVKPYHGRNEKCEFMKWLPGVVNTL